MNLPFYISWAQQKDASTFEILSVDGPSFTTNLGKKIIDMSSISYQAHFGYNHPTIIKHLKNQLDTIPICSPKGTYPDKIKITQNLLKYMGKNNGKLFYTVSGAESVENALKIARDYTQKKIILARANSYHGASLGALMATGDWRNPTHQTPEGWVVRIPDTDEEDAILKTREIILRHGAFNIAGMILETITGGNGVYAGNKKWWQGIKDLCLEFNILLILDEVVCGFHRTGKAFGYMHFEIKADIICLAKGISGGMVPFGAVYTNQAIADYYQDHLLSCGLTNYAHPLGLAALKGVLEIVQDNLFQENLKILEKKFAEELIAFKKYSIVKNIRVEGMLAAIDLNSSINGNIFLEQGIYLVSQKNRLILAPPLIISLELLSKALDTIALILSEAK